MQHISFLFGCEKLSQHPRVAASVISGVLFRRHLVGFCEQRIHHGLDRTDALAHNTLFGFHIGSLDDFLLDPSLSAHKGDPVPFVGCVIVEGIAQQLTLIVANDERFRVPDIDFGGEDTAVPEVSVFCLGIQVQRL